MKAQDIMIRQAHTIPPQCTIGEALRQMTDLRLQDFPVVGEKKMLLGTLNFWQILERAMPPYISQGDLPDVRFAPNLVRFHERLGELKPNPVTQVMNPHPPCARPDDSVLACAALIMKTPKTVYLLPVVEGDHQLVGIISAWDIIKEIAG
ncbi:CBS domain-containing protein [Candidatus Nitrospira allomarina]|uniref:CBS domain-containing protein n=1 Tax=Candidatus Nitrospira allomarina TaxID=3020900 RepID=A0AA96JT62_9BACT|nr:CBS domain-containing protein [Candidatus Nitrospira allomarina]WNM59247.1 CBS domain-containing protein [Candidatus Nitrospira allomarina]